MVEREVIFIVDTPAMRQNGWSAYPKNFKAHFHENRAQWLVDNGYAKFTIENEIKQLNDNEDIAIIQGNQLNDMTLSQLKEMAKMAGVKGYYKMNKDELLAVLNV